MNSRESTSDYLQLDVRWLKRQGILHPPMSREVTWSRDGQPFAKIIVECDRRDRVRLQYTHGARSGDPVEHDDPVTIERVPCNFGGSRPYFLCPSCDRRCAILYGAKIFACRECRHLVYESSKVSGDPLEEARLAFERAAAKLDVDQGGELFGPPLPDKPKHMHWSTYATLLEEYHQARREFAGVARSALNLPLR